MYFYKRLLFASSCLGLILTATYWRLSHTTDRGPPDELQVFSLLTPTVSSVTSPEERLQERKNHVHELCKHYHLGIYNYQNGTNSLGLKESPTPQYSYFFLHREKNLAWCPVYKAGSTSWLHQMLLLKGYSEDFLQHPPQQLSIFARQVFSDPSPGKDFDHAKKILIVRHPFERLVSAYHDKLSNSTVGLEHGTAYFYDKYSKKIVKKFRTNKSFHQLEPTFEEFVRYLIHTDLANYGDDHWIPAYLTCTPCRVNYDFIGKVETYAEDQDLIINKMNLNLQPLWHHRTNSEQHHQQVSTRAQQYFSTLSKPQVQKLYEKYFLDFSLFRYSYEPYLQYTSTHDAM